jgi:hypothetical protein
MSCIQEVVVGDVLNVIDISYFLMILVVADDSIL